MLTRIGLLEYVHQIRSRGELLSQALTEDGLFNPLFDGRLHVVSLIDILQELNVLLRVTVHTEDQPPALCVDVRRALEAEQIIPSLIESVGNFAITRSTENDSIHSLSSAVIRDQHLLPREAFSADSQF